MDETQETIAIANKPRDYAGLLWIFLAGALGFTLFCATSAIALSDPTLPTPIVIEPGNIANLAFSNLNTAAALTAEALQDLVATSTPSATFTSTLTATQTASPTASPTQTRTPFIPSRTPTKQEQPPPKATIVLPTATRTQKPTNTPIIIVPITGTATVVEPPTETPVPEPSNTPIPPTIPPPTIPPPTIPPPTIPPPTPTP